jgi:hypothetical protein
MNPLSQGLEIEQFVFVGWGTWGAYFCDLDFTSEWLLVLSAYPYDLESNVTHFVLFRRIDICKMITKDHCNTLRQFFNGCHDLL